MTTSQEGKISWLNTITLKTKSSIERAFRVNKKSSQKCWSLLRMYKYINLKQFQQYFNICLKVLHDIKVYAKIIECLPTLRSK
jgi:hypothetical protein